MVLQGHFVRRVLQLDVGVPHRLQSDLRRLRARTHAETVRQVRRRCRKARLLNPRRVSEKPGGFRWRAESTHPVFFHAPRSLVILSIYVPWELRQGDKERRVPGSGLESG